MDNLRKERLRMIFAGLACLGVVAIIWCQIVIYKDSIPEEIFVVNGKASKFHFAVPAIADIQKTTGQEYPIDKQGVTTESNQTKQERAVSVMKHQVQTKKTVACVRLTQPFVLRAEHNANYEMKIKLFGLFALKTVPVYAVESQKLIPGGQAIGIYVETSGVLVLGTTPILNQRGEYVSPCEKIIVKGDYITAIDGKEIHYKSELMKQVQAHKTKPMHITLRRNKRTIQVKVKPVKVKNASEYKCGIWVRDDTQGIGTLTFQKENGEYGALGHGVSDVDTGKLLESVKGNIYEAAISYIIPGTQGKPGELVGSIDYATVHCLGSIKKNTPHGIYGQGGIRLQEYSTGRAIPICMKQDIQTGKAYIKSAISGSMKLYEINIDEVNTGKNKRADLVYHVTDEGLLSLTGGIVQGMSGSPILQNGKIIGAVTHVFVSDPSKGYGIFIEKMQ